MLDTSQHPQHLDDIRTLATIERSGWRNRLARIWASSTPMNAAIDPGADPAAAAAAPDTTDWQKRYTDLQPEYTRATQALKDAESVWEDEQAAFDRVREKFPHWLEDEPDPEPEPDPDDEPDDPRFAKLAELEKWQAQVESERREARLNADLKTELGDRTVPEKATAWIKARTYALGDNPKALKQAVEEWTELTSELTSAPAKPKPRAPHVLPNGVPATGTKAWADMTDAEALAAQVERLQALST